MERYEVPDIARWKKLYQAADCLWALRPWEILGAGDCVAVASPGKPDVFCSVMGGGAQSRGVSLFVGPQGYRDYLRLRDLDSRAESLDYVTRDLTCLSLYWGDREEVPPDQRKVLRELDRSYRGRGCWPYLLSCKSRFQPASLSLEEAELCADALSDLFTVVRAVADERFSPEGFGENLLLCTRGEEDGQRKICWAPTAPAAVQVPVVEWKDPERLKALREAPQGDDTWIVDLAYLSEKVPMRAGNRYDATLVCYILSEQSNAIAYMEVVPPEVEESVAAVSAFATAANDLGLPKTLRARNFRVLGALRSVCRKCKVQLKAEALPESDEIQQNLGKYLASRESGQE